MKLSYTALSDAKPPVQLEESEYDFRIIAASHGISRNTGRGRLEVILVADGQKNTEPIRKYFTDPSVLEEWMSRNEGKTKEDHAEWENRNAMSLRYFLHHFGIPRYDESGNMSATGNDIELTDFLNKTAKCRTMKQKEPNPTTGEHDIDILIPRSVMA